jgi:hypothetical protein
MSGVCEDQRVEHGRKRIGQGHGGAYHVAADVREGAVFKILEALIIMLQTLAGFGVAERRTARRAKSFRPRERCQVGAGLKVVGGVCD